MTTCQPRYQSHPQFSSVQCNNSKCITGSGTEATYVGCAERQRSHKFGLQFQLGCAQNSAPPRAQEGGQGVGNRPPQVIQTDLQMASQTLRAIEYSNKFNKEKFIKNGADDFIGGVDQLWLIIGLITWKLPLETCEYLIGT